jgi:hypothetical protein
MGKAKPFDVPKREVWEAFNVESQPGSGARPLGIPTVADRIAQGRPPLLGAVSGAGVSPTGNSVMETAEHQEPYESRGSRTDLGAPGGESPLGDST